MLTFKDIATFLSVSGSGANLGKAGVDTGAGTVSFVGVQTIGPTQQIYFILQDNSLLELKEEYVLTKIQ